MTETESDAAKSLIAAMFLHDLNVKEIIAIQDAIEILLIEKIPADMIEKIAKKNVHATKMYNVLFCPDLADVPFVVMLLIYRLICCHSKLFLCNF